ncbi:hypothetical protein SDC9_177153 [bioreactor metagenome]|uniref:Uncharacterized protein n=1 Tax=bioreactor metagenome TaxID=1076179 RepID=A0A645GTR9_9ZZZZ
MAGGDENTLTRTGDGDRNSEIGIIAVVDHHGDEHRTDGGDVRNSGAADAAEEHGGKDVHLGKTAAHAPDEGVGEGHQAAGYATLAHDLTAEDEERDGQQAERVHPAHQALHDGHHRQVQVHRRENRRQEQREGDRELEDQHQHEGADQDEGTHACIHHTCAPPLNFLRSSVR